MHTSAGKTENGGKNETPALKSYKNKLYSKKYIKIPQWVPLGVFKTFFLLREAEFEMVWSFYAIQWSVWLIQISEYKGSLSVFKTCSVCLPNVYLYSTYIIQMTPHTRDSQLQQQLPDFCFEKSI